MPPRPPSPSTLTPPAPAPQLSTFTTLKASLMTAPPFLAMARTASRALSAMTTPAPGSRQPSTAPGNLM